MWSVAIICGKREWWAPEVLVATGGHGARGGGQGTTCRHCLFTWSSGCARTPRIRSARVFVKSDDILPRRCPELSCRQGAIHYRRIPEVVNGIKRAASTHTGRMSNEQRACTPALETHGAHQWHHCLPVPPPPTIPPQGTGEQPAPCKGGYAVLGGYDLKRVHPRPPLSRGHLSFCGAFLASAGWRAAPDALCAARMAAGRHAQQHRGPGRARACD